MRRHRVGRARAEPVRRPQIVPTPVNHRLRADPAARYRGADGGAQVLEGEALREELARRTRSLCQRTDATMLHLRAMLIYAGGDPRAKNVNYPTWGWFEEDEGVPLRPTL